MRSAASKRQKIAHRAARRRGDDPAPRVAARREGWRAQGINEWDALAAIASHDGKCALCAATKPGGMGDWHVDHSADTGRVRGVLCAGCNMLLGRVEKLGLAKIETYLKENHE
jgi:hypothetical protein